MNRKTVIKIALSVLSLSAAVLMLWYIANVVLSAVNLLELMGRLPDVENYVLRNYKFNVAFQVAVLAFSVLTIIALNIFLWIGDRQKKPAPALNENSCPEFSKSGNADGQV
ncbi:MAG: hypothetical protein LBP26_04425 [Clostridiales bacterium]|jgi:hypothetical protein|nr:hypothetical protein [Clostridiales bacterium]